MHLYDEYRQGDPSEANPVFLDETHCKIYNPMVRIALDRQIVFVGKDDIQSIPQRGPGWEVCA